MMIDEWSGCYPSQWVGMIVPGAIVHPAKFSSRLIRRIYEHITEEGWVKPGDMVVDPFAGVALGALDAMRLGLAEVMAGDDNVVSVAMDEKENKSLMDELFLCPTCYMGDINLAQIIERRNEKLEADHDQNKSVEVP